MNIIGCLDVPTSGSYKINNVEVGKMNKDQLAELRCKTFGFIFQRYNLLTSLSADENAALPAIYSGLNASDRNKRAVQLLKQLDRETNWPTSQRTLGRTAATSQHCPGTDERR